MRLLRVGIIVAFVAVCVASVMLYLSSDEDTTVPVLNCSTEMIEAPCSVSEKELLSYVTAYDEKDGDLTDNIVVESVSGFIDKGVSNVVFSVSDNDNHVVKKTVALWYSDYKDPTFSLKNDLIYPVGGKADLSNNVTVHDMIDGDVTGWLITTADDFTTDSAGVYDVTYSVTTGKSYTYSLTLPVIVEAQTNTDYDLILSDNLVYCNTGAKLDYDSYVKSVVTPFSQKTGYTLKVDSSEVNLGKAGIYNVYYSVVVGNAVVAKTRLIIVCGEVMQ